LGFEHAALVMMRKLKVVLKVSSKLSRHVFHCTPAWGTVEHFEDTSGLDSLSKNV